MKRFVHASASILVSLLLLLFLASCRNFLPLQKAEGRAPAPEKVKPEQFLEAAEQGDLDQVRELIARDPSLLDVRDSSGWDALSYAAWDAHQQVHEYLLRQGAEGNLFTEAALGPLESFLRRLETNPIGVDSRDAKLKASPLIWAVRTGNQVGCEVLLSRGADVQVHDREGNTALHHAALMGRLELIGFRLCIWSQPPGTMRPACCFSTGGPPSLIPTVGGIRPCTSPPNMGILSSASFFYSSVRRQTKRTTTDRPPSIWLESRGTIGWSGFSAPTCSSMPPESLQIYRCIDLPGFLG
jgi:hypothetical protein